MEYKGGFARWAPGRGLSFLLYSPAHDGGHIKWPPVRAELAIKQNLVRSVRLVAL